MALARQPGFPQDDSVSTPLQEYYPDILGTLGDDIFLERVRQAVVLGKSPAAFANSQLRKPVSPRGLHGVCNRDTVSCRSGACCVSDVFRVMVLNLRQSHML